MRLSVRQRAGQVVLRSELAELGSASQVSHALKVLQRDGDLIRLGVGVYAKAQKDEETGAIRPLVDFETLAQEAAAKLKMNLGPKNQDADGTMTSLKWPCTSFLLDTGHRRVSRKLSLGDRTVVYVNDRTRKHQAERLSKVRPAIPTSGVAKFVRDFARQLRVDYTPTFSDQWAETVTRLAGDEVRSGPVQDLLVALKRAGKLSSDEMAELLVNHLRERKQGVRST